MNVLVTGAAGALGRNLVENLKAIRDGKNRTRPNIQIDAIYEYDRDKNDEVISGYPDANNHSIDAVRYGTERFWKRRGN